MEDRHAANILRKAERAAELIEHVLLERIYPDETRHDALDLAHDAMFGPANPMGEHLWESLGIVYALHHNKNQVVTFETSKPVIGSLLRSRIRATDTDQPDDPFDIFASNVSGQN